MLRRYREAWKHEQLPLRSLEEVVRDPVDPRLPPTLYPPNTFKDHPLAKVGGSVDFQRVFRQHYPEVDRMLQEVPGAAVAGGLVSQMLVEMRQGLEHNPAGADIDIFLDAEDMWEDTVRIGELLCRPGDKRVLRPGMCSYLLYRGGKAPMDVQVLNNIESLTRQVSTFDISACSVLYDGHRVLFSEMGAYAHVNATIIVDCTYCAYTYTWRMMKYHRRGWGVTFSEMGRLPPPGTQFRTTKIDDSGHLVMTQEPVRSNCGSIKEGTPPEQIKDARVDTYPLSDEARQYQPSVLHVRERTPFMHPPSYWYGNDFDYLQD